MVEVDLDDKTRATYGAIEASDVKDDRSVVRTYGQSQTIETGVRVRILSQLI